MRQRRCYSIALLEWPSGPSILQQPSDQGSGVDVVSCFGLMHRPSCWSNSGGLRVVMEKQLC
jgi:hypothetical protein